MKKKIFLGARILLGLIFTVFGANGLAMIVSGQGFIPMPPPSPEMGAVMAGLFSAQYLMPLVKLIEVIAGLLLLSGKYVRLALVLLGPIVVNIMGLHLFVEFAGLPMSFFVCILWGIVYFQHRHAFDPIFKA